MLTVNDDDQQQIETALEVARCNLWHAITEYEEHLGDYQQTTIATEGISLVPPLEELLDSYKISKNSVLPLGIIRHQLLECRTPGIEPKTIITTSPSTAVTPPASALVLYGVEVRHMPLSRCLPHAPKFVSTADWLLAREEVKFSRYFERVLELRLSGSWPTRDIPPSRGGQRMEWDGEDNHWDALLEEAWFLAREMTQEIKWKRYAARVLAQEAVAHHQRQKKKIIDNLARPLSTPLTVKGSRRILQGINQVFGPGSGLFRTSLSLPNIIEDSLAGGRGEKLQLQNSPELASSPSLPLPMPHSSGPTCNSRPPSWNSLEDAMLLRLVRDGELGGWEAIRFGINLHFHGGRSVRTTLELIQRHTDLLKRREGDENNWMLNFISQAAIQNAKIHLARMSIMNSMATKLITPRISTAANNGTTSKKLNLVAHPSHEAAARKANQSISKFFTPQELALRRVQRARFMGAAAADPAAIAAILSASSGSGSTPAANANINVNSGIQAVSGVPGVGVTIIRPPASAMAPNSVTTTGVSTVPSAIGASPQVGRVIMGQNIPMNSGQPTSSSTMNVPGSANVTENGAPTRLNPLTHPTNGGGSGGNRPLSIPGISGISGVPAAANVPLSSIPGASVSMPSAAQAPAQIPLVQMPTMTLQQQQQQKQALLSRSQHLGSYINNIQTTSTTHTVRSPSQQSVVGGAGAPQPINNPTTTSSVSQQHMGSSTVAGSTIGPRPSTEAKSSELPSSQNLMVGRSKPSPKRPSPS